MLHIPNYDNWKTSVPDNFGTDFNINEEQSEPGYRELTTEIFVSKEDAFNYAIENCINNFPERVRCIEWTQEFRDMLIEWFYSGNWIKEGLWD